MKNIFVIIIAILFLGILIPKIFIKDSYELSQDDRDTVMLIAYGQLEHPIEKLLITRIAVDALKDEIVYISAYTLWGLKYATIELNFSHGSRVTWRRWSGR